MRSGEAAVVVVVGVEELDVISALVEAVAVILVDVIVGVPVDPIFAAVVVVLLSVKVVVVVVFNVVGVVVYVVVVCCCCSCYVPVVYVVVDQLDLMVRWRWR